MNIEKSPVPQEQLYLSILATGNYLQDRPEILNALDWLRKHKMDLGIPLPANVFQLFTDIQKQLAIAPRNDFGEDRYSQRCSQWLLFLIINVMIRRPPGMDLFGMPNFSFRFLYRFIACGTDGCCTEDSREGKGINQKKAEPKLEKKVHQYVNQRR